MHVDNQIMLDNQMIAVLHNLANMYEKDAATADTGKVLRDVAHRLYELTETAASRRHWTGHE